MLLIFETYHKNFVNMIIIIIINWPTPSELKSLSFYLTALSNFTAPFNNSELCSIDSFLFCCHQSSYI